MKVIELTRDYRCIVDDADYEQLSQYRWVTQTTGGTGPYASARICGRNTLMHRLIVEAPPGFDVDHVNGDTLDNRRENLRVCSRAQNMANSRGHSDSRSGYKGVSWYKAYGKWCAQIRHSGRRHFLGYFESAEDAARAYNDAAKAAHGDFAYLNPV